MGRGLSELQKAILRRALANQKAEGRSLDESRFADVLRAEVLADYWGWPMPPRGDGDRYRTNMEGLQERHIGGRLYSPRQIGEKRYGSAQTALTRAMNRLADRGLMTLVQGRFSHWSGANLTENGVRVATTLSVNCRVKLPTT
jgi:hypothetical protein